MEPQVQIALVPSINLGAGQKSQGTRFLLEENQSCSLTFNAIERRFLFCSLPKPCAACHTGKVGNMELQSRSKRRSQMPMCPPNISTGTPWKKWVDSSLNRIRPRNQQEHGLQQKACVLLCGWTWGGVAIALTFVILLVRHLVYQRLHGRLGAALGAFRMWLIGVDGCWVLLMLFEVDCCWSVARWQEKQGIKGPGYQRTKGERANNSQDQSRNNKSQKKNMT